MRPARLYLAALLTLFTATPLAAAPPPGVTSPLSPSRVTVVDYSRRADVNQLSMLTSNMGGFAFDGAAFASGGLLYPRGTTKSLLYAGGLWLGARVAGNVRVTVAEYSSEYGPGGMVGTSFDDPSRPEYRTWKVVRWTGIPNDSAHVDRAGSEYVDAVVHHSWSEYMANAAPRGAPWRLHRLPDSSTPDPADSVDVPGPDVIGDQMLWSIFNDADAARHYNDAGGTTPLGVEVQQTTFAFNALGPLGRVVFMRYRLVNKGANHLSDAYLGLWSDPDLGGFADDLVGCDTTLSLGYCYNGDNDDVVYGPAPPAVGLQILQGPRLAAGQRLGATAFQRFINGTDPATEVESYNYMRGLTAQGDTLHSPSDGPTTFAYSGDPLASGGWVDSQPADRRMFLCSGPFTMAPGDTQVVVVAVIVGAGSNRLASVRDLRCMAKYARGIFAAGFPLPFPPMGDDCAPTALSNCPRSAAYWAAECAAPTNLSPIAISTIGSGVWNASAFLNVAIPSPSFCDVVAAGPGADVRAQAKGEFVAFQANLVATSFGTQEFSGDPVRLWESTFVEGSCLGASTIRDLAGRGTHQRQPTGAGYLDLDPTHPPGLVGVNWGLPFFGGGAGSGWDFFGGTIDPAVQPDSFSTVELRFSHTATQKAYRFLRRQLADGTGQGGYDYGGHHTVNMQAWDVVNNVQLDLAFVEKVVVDEGGTIQPPGAQVATFDSTWAPTTDATGDREYLFVIRRPYSDTPKAEIAQDATLISDVLPLMWFLGARKPNASAVTDDGDAFRFNFGLPQSVCVDQRLINLEGQLLSDPAVAQEYQDIVDCLSAINAGNRIGPICDAATPALLSLVSADATRDRVRLEWRSDVAGLRASIERRTDATAWSHLAEATADGSGAIVYEDRDVQPGRRYGYRLVLPGEGGPEAAGETWVDVPLGHALAIRTLRCAGSRVLADVTLASGTPAKLELLDVAGRRVFGRRFDGPEPGERAVDVGGAGLAPGLYFVRLAQDGQRVTAKRVLIR